MLDEFLHQFHWTNIYFRTENPPKVLRSRFNLFTWDFVRRNLRNLKTSSLTWFWIKYVMKRYVWKRALVKFYSRFLKMDNLQLIPKLSNPKTQLVSAQLVSIMKSEIFWREGHFN